MQNQVKLEDLLEAIEFQMDDITYFVHRPTGTVIMVDGQHFSAVEEDGGFENLAEWEQEAIAQIMDIEDNPKDYVALPTAFEINEYGIMEDFCFSLANEIAKERLLNAIKGKGAFRRFKSTLASLQLQDNWYEFRDQSFRQIAIKWCKNNDVEYVDERG